MSEFTRVLRSLYASHALPPPPDEFPADGVFNSSIVANRAPADARRDWKDAIIAWGARVAVDVALDTRITAPYGLRYDGQPLTAEEVLASSSPIDALNSGAIYLLKDSVRKVTEVLAQTPQGQHVNQTLASLSVRTKFERDFLETDEDITEFASEQMFHAFQAGLTRFFGVPRLIRKRLDPSTWHGDPDAALHLLQTSTVASESFIREFQTIKEAAMMAGLSRHKQRDRVPDLPRRWAKVETDPVLHIELKPNLKRVGIPSRHHLNKDSHSEFEHWVERFLRDVLGRGRTSDPQVPFYLRTVGDYHDYIRKTAAADSGKLDQADRRVTTCPILSQRDATLGSPNRAILGFVALSYALITDDLREAALQSIQGLDGQAARQNLRVVLAEARGKSIRPDSAVSRKHDKLVDQITGSRSIDPPGLNT